MNPRFSTRAGTALLISGIAGCALVGLGIGSAVAQIPIVTGPVGLSSADGIATTQQASPKYPVNSRGLTYGSLADSISPATEPNLVYVVATNGKTGYALNTDLSVAEGPSDFKSPEEALAWQASVGGTDSHISVYDQEGKAVVGEFVIHHATAGEIQAVQPKPAP